jgi:hypothetical protein
VGLLQSRSQTWKITERDLLISSRWSVAFLLEAFIQIMIYKSTRTFTKEHAHLSVTCIVCPSHIATTSQQLRRLTCRGGNNWWIHASVKNVTRYWRIELPYPCTWSPILGEPFICDMCAKAMTSKDSLKSHWLIHTGEKLVSLFCGKAFNKSCNFHVQYCTRARTHTHTHTQVRPLWEVLQSEFCAYHPHTHILMAHVPYDYEIYSKGFVSRHPLNILRKTCGMCWVYRLLLGVFHTSK